MKRYTIDQVAEHDTEQSCWIIIDRQVYDVTSFLQEHPGGMEYLLDNAGGIDATIEFENYRHSSLAREMLKKYWIGILEENQVF